VKFYGAFKNFPRTICSSFGATQDLDPSFHIRVRIWIQKFLNGVMSKEELVHLLHWPGGVTVLVDG